tara:strand:+ start:13 stop:321 length:309 start_codon:yes stop_codon:yes gene_type:complete
MKQTVDEYTFKNAFSAQRPNNFTWGGLSALYDYLIDLEHDTGEEFELDVVGLCCEYSEYKDFDEIKEAYDVKGLNEDETKEWLAYNGSPVIEHDEGVIIQDF